MDITDLNESGYESPSKKAKVDSLLESLDVHDNVHGMIEVPSLCRVIMDTPQFASLRCKKQLGCAHYVYPTATHSRFQHSLGVMYLGGWYYQNLVKATPDLLYDHVDHLCVQVAGLIHDLGHGPFSHLWEQFVTEARPERKWTHEEASLEMFKYLIKVNDISLMCWNIKPQDVMFIMELVVGPLGNRGSPWPYKGRGMEKAFLYEIIANHECGIDVDKMDYIKRDAKALGLSQVFEIERFFRNASVSWDKSGKSFISFRKGKEAVMALFQDRARLHDRAYQHKTVKIIERMTLDMLLSADPFLDIVKKPDGGWVRMSRACDNPQYFEILSDEFVEKSIQYSRSKDLEKARQILKRIHTRDFYALAFIKDYLKFDKDVETCEKELLEVSKSMELDQVNVVEDVAVILRKINNGGGRTYERAIYNDKRGGGVHYRMSKEMIEQSNLIPSVKSYVTVMVVCRRKEATEDVKELAAEWAAAKLEDEMPDNFIAIE